MLTLTNLNYVAWWYKWFWHIALKIGCYILPLGFTWTLSGSWFVPLMKDQFSPSISMWTLGEAHWSSSVRVIGKITLLLKAHAACFVKPIVLVFLQYLWRILFSVWIPPNTNSTTLHNTGTPNIVISEAKHEDSALFSLYLNVQLAFTFTYIWVYVPLHF